MKNLLLSIIAIGVLAIGGMLAYDRIVEPGVHTEDWFSAERLAVTDGEIGCAGSDGILTLESERKDPAFNRCVDRAVDERMAEWEKDHPEMVWE